MKRIQNLIHKYLKGLSLRPDEGFIRTLIKVCGVVFVWRGIWNLTDTYLFPDMFITSNLASILIGIGLLYLLDSDLRNLH